MVDVSHAGGEARAQPERRRRPRRPARAERRSEERVVLLGEAVDLVRPEEVLSLIARRAAGRVKTVIANHNLNSLHLISRTPGMRRFYDLAELTEVDSRPLLAFARLIGHPARGCHRCTYLDWREHFWSLANRNGWRVMYVGGEEAVVQRAAATLRKTYPKAMIAVRNGYFDARRGCSANERVLAAVSKFDPHILFVGMGMPRQEVWVAENYERLPDSVILSVGAAFDYEAGAQKAAPRWMGRVGLEWLFRLAHDPRRLARRYLVEPWRLAAPAWADVKTILARRRTGQGPLHIRR